MKKNIAAILVVWFVCFSGSSAFFISGDEYYTKYDWKTFFQLPKLSEKVDLIKPDYDLLNAAVFHAVNEQSEKAGRTPFKYSYELQSAALFHSQQMMEHKFFSHKNSKDTAYLNPTRRVRRNGGYFVFIGENIARISAMNYGRDKFSVYKQDDLYKYYHPNGKEEIEADTYANLARRAVVELHKGSDNKANFLFKKFEYLGCGAAVVSNPYRTRKLPVVYFTQNFGGYKE